MSTKRSRHIYLDTWYINMHYDLIWWWMKMDSGCKLNTHTQHKNTYNLRIVAFAVVFCSAFSLALLWISCHGPRKVCKANRRAKENREPAIYLFACFTKISLRFIHYISTYWACVRVCVWKITRTNDSLDCDPNPRIFGRVSGHQLEMLVFNCSAVSSTQGEMGLKISACLWWWLLFD